MLDRNGHTLALGDVVSVGAAYFMADDPPFAGRGTMRPDDFTGRVLTVVGFSGEDVELAERSDGDVLVALSPRRLDLIS